MENSAKRGNATILYVELCVCLHLCLDFGGRRGGKLHELTRFIIYVNLI